MPLLVRKSENAAGLWKFLEWKRQRDRVRKKQRDRETERQKDRETEREREAKKER